LDDFTEQGSWDNNAWYNPQGLFDWSAVDRFEIVSEQHALTGMTFGFDEIRVLAPGESDVEDNAIRRPRTFSLNQNLPNTFNPATTIQYGLPQTGDVSISVFNAAGQRVRTLTTGNQTKGEHETVWDGRDDAGLPVSSGIYFCRMKASGFIQIRKMVLIE
jgi:hypothetical protein